MCVRVSLGLVDFWDLVDVLTMIPQDLCIPSVLTQTLRQCVTICHGALIVRGEQRKESTVERAAPREW